MMERRAGIGAVALRTANMQDWARLYGWRNDPDTVAASIEGDPVSLNIHMDWLRRTIDDPTVRLYVVHEALAGEPLRAVGTARLNQRLNPVTEVELSLTVDPRHRGRGLASIIVERLVHAARVEFRDCPAMTAVVKGTNLSSLKAFAASGFLPGLIDRELVHLRRRM